MGADERNKQAVDGGAGGGADLAQLDRSTRERRLKVRCWRRGTKEMDLILGGFFDNEGADLSDAELTAFEALIGEEDDALYRWVSGGEAAPERHAPLIERLKRRFGSV